MVVVVVVVSRAGDAPQLGSTIVNVVRKVSVIEAWAGVSMAHRSRIPGTACVREHPCDALSVAAPDEPMTLRAAAAITRAHLESFFPRRCSRCQRGFSSLADYLRNTTHVDAPVSFDADLVELPASPVGTISMANCACGTTLALGSEGMPHETLVQLMTWARDEIAARGVPLRTVLLELRDEVDRETLADG